MLCYPCHMPRNPYFLFSSFSQQFPLTWYFSFSRFPDSLSSALHQGIVLSPYSPPLHVLGSVSSVPLPNACHVWKDKLAIFSPFQVALSIHLESKRKHHIKNQEPNFKSRSQVVKFRFRQIKFDYFFPHKLPIISFLSLSSGEILLEVGTDNFLASSVSLQNKCFFFFFK